MATPDEIANDVVKDFNRRSGERGVYEDYWDEIAQLVEPTMRDNIRFGDMSVPGERKFDKQMDSEPTRALSKFAAIMDSLLTPKGSIWHRLVPSDRQLLADRETKLYFEELNDRLFQFRYAPVANFSSQNQLVYRGLGSFGSAAMFVDPLDTGRGIRYKHCHVGELYWRENHQGIVDDVIRRIPMTMEQLMGVKLWADKARENVDLAKAAQSNPNKQVTVLHRVRPRADMDPEAFDYTAMPYESEYVLLQGIVPLHSGGYRSFPYAPTRYEQSPNEVYGHSPAMQVFASIRTLQVQKKTTLKTAHRNADPILLIHDDGLMDQVSLRPGATISGGISADGRRLVDTLPVGNPNIGLDMMQQEKEDIRDAFLIRLFQILQDTPRMTATEVLERAREKGMLLAPTVGRQETEYLGPLISREIEVLERQGLLPDIPPALAEAEGEYTIVYDSPLSKVARAEEAAGLQRTLEVIMPYMQNSGDFSPLDNFDLDVIAREYAYIQAVPPSWMREDGRVAEIRQARAQARQNAIQQDNAAQNLQAAAAAKKAGITEEDLA